MSYAIIIFKTYDTEEISKPLLLTCIAWTAKSNPLSKSNESGIGASLILSLKDEGSAVASWEKSWYKGNFT